MWIDGYGTRLKSTHRQTETPFKPMFAIYLLEDDIVRLCYPRKWKFVEHNFTCSFYDLLFVDVILAKKRQWIRHFQSIVVWMVTKLSTRGYQFCHSVFFAQFARARKTSWIRTINRVKTNFSAFGIISGKIYSRRYEL